jgi:molybdopterin/thiamine biosynthesis adenylyltransferase
VAHLVQVGAGSGGMPVLDMVCRDARIHRVTVIEPDVYKPHNVVRHLFGPEEVGQPKGLLAERWLKERRPDLEVVPLLHDLCDPQVQPIIEQAVASADLGICAADNEPAKFHFDALMRRHGKPWTLGEVLSGGIAGFVHCFLPGEACYGCVASFLQRSVQVDNSPPPDYSQPGGAVPEVTIPASRASIGVIASLHALITLNLLGEEPDARPAAWVSPGFTSLLLTLKKVPEMFEEAFRPYRFHVPRAADCLICQAGSATVSGEDLDVALAQALARLRDDE